MNLKIKDKIITSLSMYLVLLLISIYFYRIGSLFKYSDFITIGLLMIIIKDIMLFFIDFEKVTTIKNTMTKLNKDYTSGDLSFGDYYIFMNRNYYFPGLLIFYLVFILLRQIDLLDFIGDSLYTLMNTNFLGLVVVSGVMTTFRELVDKKYQRKVKSYEGLYKNLIINTLLSIIGALVILMQTVDLGLLSNLIGLISGILIFLVGVSIMEEEEL
ncbi:MAG: hypothetical protein Q8K30_03335 [Candidatus Gracilibacteria bacterium]|nr:hypothetical protein [Candidatus Gracilibacteria bacterium]